MKLTNTPLKTLEYADELLLASYPASQLSDEDKRRVDESTTSVVEVLTRPDFIIYALGQALSSTVTSFFRKLEEMTDEATALRVARELGKDHANANYGRFLRNRGLAGGPAAFCEYEDFAHGLRGPRHVTALFARHDDSTVVVHRTDCLYFCGTRGEPNKYIAALETGMYDGYKQVDPLLDHVENPHCLCKGSPHGCEHRFVFRDAGTEEVAKLTPEEHP